MSGCGWWRVIIEARLSEPGGTITSSLMAQRASASRPEDLARLILERAQRRRRRRIGRTLRTGCGAGAAGRPDCDWSSRDLYGLRATRGRPTPHSSQVSSYRPFAAETLLAPHPAYPTGRSLLRWIAAYGTAAGCGFSTSRVLTAQSHGLPTTLSGRVKLVAAEADAVDWRAVSQFALSVAPTAGATGCHVVSLGDCSRSSSLGIRQVRLAGSGPRGGGRRGELEWW